MTPWVMRAQDRIGPASEGGRVTIRFRDDDGQIRSRRVSIRPVPDPLARAARRSFRQTPGAG